ncbi:hypothetical protein OHA77_39795 [Streptosporangium sp. NBC_01639]|nr:hypothetical protein OHA77_39795 [Streptosporangium sp. NBC_01639]
MVVTGPDRRLFGVAHGMDRIRGRRRLRRRGDVDDTAQHGGDYVTVATTF